ncbi:MAG: hypothetical protein PHU85_20070 [Phycisphaerae bacterium]|nr:hypothetical protein [Phycisphaerae bacterium]
MSYAASNRAAKIGAASSFQPPKGWLLSGLSDWSDEITLDACKRNPLS